jgi:hypothetical protein
VQIDPETAEPVEVETPNEVWCAVCVWGGEGGSDAFTRATQSLCASGCAHTDPTVSTRPWPLLAL